MPSLANYTWERTTTTTKTFAKADGPPLLDLVPTARAEQEATTQTAVIIDGPTIPASRAPWVPTEIIVKDGRNFNPEATRKVSIHGHYLKKNGTPSTYQAGDSWQHLGKWTGNGSLHAMPAWVAELVAQMEPAAEGVLT